MRRIEHESELSPYAPPGHSGTRNLRLVERSFCGHFEMVLGEIAPGGVAEAHSHAIEYQAMYVLAGRCDVRLDDEPPAECGPGSVIRIPAGTVHEVVAKGSEPLRLMIVYSPPLPPRADVALGPEGA